MKHQKQKMKKKESLCAAGVTSTCEIKHLLSYLEITIVPGIKVSNNFNADSPNSSHLTIESMDRESIIRITYYCSYVNVYVK